MRVETMQEAIEGAPTLIVADGEGGVTFHLIEDAVLLSVAEEMSEANGWDEQERDNLYAALCDAIERIGAIETGEPTLSERVELKYIEFRPRPKKDGLHDSGYRFIRLVGVDGEGNDHDLGEWHDHLIVEPKCNIDVEPDGTIRIMPWSQTKFHFDPERQWFTSTAWVSDDGGFS